MLERVLLEEAMRRAFVIARRGPADDPNPQVGCVLLDPVGAIIAEGWHMGAGSPHAEVAALDRLPAPWRDRAAAVTAVVTLEPCNHTGRTGPCALALIEAGIGSVVYAVSDPGSDSSGGAGRLIAAGVSVLSGVLAAEGSALIAPWFARHPSGRDGRGVSPPRTTETPRPPLPHVTVKWAQTLDGRAAAADGSSQWITGATARAHVHTERAKADAILVGTGTLLADDPSLTARTPDGGLLVSADGQPVPVVIGTRKIPTDARIRRHPALAANGLTAPLQFTGERIIDDLAELHTAGIRRVFVEGGPTLASAFIAAGVVDDLLVYIAPALLGGPGLALRDLGVATMTDIRRLRVVRREQLGDDTVLTAAFTPQERSTSCSQDS